jgi:hypothetical protein
VNRAIGPQAGSVAVRSNDAARLENSTGALQTIRSFLAVTQETSNTPRVDCARRTTKQRNFPSFLKNINVTGTCCKDRIWTLPPSLSMEDASIGVYPAVISAKMAFYCPVCCFFATKHGTSPNRPKPGKEKAPEI